MTILCPDHASAVARMNLPHLDDDDRDRLADDLAHQCRECSTDQEDRQ